MNLLLAIVRLAAVIFIALPLACIGLILVITGGVLVGLAQIVKESA